MFVSKCVLPFQSCLEYARPYVFPFLKTGLPIFAKKVVGIWVEIALNLYVNLG